ncbi:MAG: hypothetical protein LBQ55_03010 [Treponema sp.]|jgi:hypothetical protein|nr:hypothetical protein [Treponema sp.]
MKKAVGKIWQTAGTMVLSALSVVTLGGCLTFSALSYRSIYYKADQPVIVYDPGVPNEEQSRFIIPATIEVLSIDGKKPNWQMDSEGFYNGRFFGRVYIPSGVHAITFSAIYMGGEGIGFDYARFTVKQDFKAGAYYTFSVSQSERPIALIEYPLLQVYDKAKGLLLEADIPEISIHEKPYISDKSRRIALRRFWKANQADGSLAF